MVNGPVADAWRQKVSKEQAEGQKAHDRLATEIAKTIALALSGLPGVVAGVFQSADKLSKAGAALNLISKVLPRR